MCNGAMVGFSNRNQAALDMLQAWADCSMVRQCIAPLGSSRENHRQDQAVLTLLAHTLGFGATCFQSEPEGFSSYFTLSPDSTSVGITVHAYG